MGRSNRRPRKPPTRWRVHSDADGWAAEWRWPPAAGLLFLGVFLLLLLLVGFIVTQASDPGVASPRTGVVAWAVAAAVALASGWVVLALFVNRTVVRVRGGWLTVTHVPLFWRGGRRFRAADVTGVFVTAETQQGEDTDWVTYTVNIRLRDTYPRTLLASLSEASEVEFLAGGLRAALGLSREPAGG